MSVESIIEHLEEGAVSQSNYNDALLRIKKYFLNNGDGITAEKIQQLADKSLSGEFVLAFCGHFSAGKSTMINTLMGREILPSSPIPTSANVVKIKTGEAKAVAYFKNKAPVTFDYVQDLEQLKEYCKDGDEVLSVEITCPNDFLVNNASLLDTPGIDSTDAAHKVATESAMHLADVVVYMMDYNHVQSELNFQFTKMLKDKGKKLFLVVNQIDKHFDLELDFSSFKHSVEQAFKQWGVNPDGIFYTTLKAPNHPENQMGLLHDELYRLSWEKEQLLSESILRSASDLISEHEKFLQEKNQDHREELEAMVGEQDPSIALNEYEEWKTKLQKLEKGPDEFKEHVLKDIQNIIDNANLTPFTVRELAGPYLESRQNGFKVGFLFSGGKTEQERLNRLSSLHHALNEQVQANLDWHLQDLFRKIPNRFSLPFSPELLENTDRMQIPLTLDFIASQVKSGARVTGEAILNYCRELTAEIKNRYRRAYVELLDEYYQEYQSIIVSQVEILASEGDQLRTTVDALRSLQDIKKKQEEYIERLREILRQAEQNSMTSTPAVRKLETKKRTLQTETISSFVRKQAISTLVLEEARDNTSPFKKDYKQQLRQAADNLMLAADTIAGLPGQSIAIQNMQLRAERLRQNLFTVALFGAFSAGKSSFANALMGEMILPVSPNPTTATINKILPPTEEYPHGTVRVKLKSREDMTKDIQHSLSVFRLHADTIEQAVQLIEQIGGEEILPSAKPHLSFLKAVRQGLGVMQSDFGGTSLVGMEEFKELVVKEEKASFVEWIELYYSCPLTDQGISLVDTPGADSINARHTGVAFEYIKNADAVLFVTYYNHAFSHADREFLQQLGRVKDTFEMDKMFFLVNAADLAKSKDELLHVVDHVKENLFACGIRKPRLYPVSSQTALLARMLAKGELTPSAEQVYRERTGSTDSLMDPVDALSFAGFETFEADFIRFTVEELTQVAINSALGEIRRAKGKLEDFLHSAKQGDEQRKEKLAALELDWKRDGQTLSEKAAWNKEREYVSKEAQELLYYVKQRLFFKFNELFTLSFNPSILKDEPGKNARKLVEQCFDEFMRNVSFSLEQEVRATTLRMEKHVNGLAQGLMEDYQRSLASEIELVFTPVSLEVPEFSAELKYDLAQVRPILSLYKSPKHFFEQGGRETFRNKLEDWLQTPATSFIEECLGHLQAFYGESLEKIMKLLIEQLKNQINDYYQGMSSVLKDGLNVAELERANSALAELME
jgi:small GTP-binding protein